MPSKKERSINKLIDIREELEKLADCSLKEISNRFYRLLDRLDKVIEVLKMPIDKPYAYHKPSPLGLEKINTLRADFSNMEEAIRDICPESRQRAIAITKLEEAAMWAIKAVVFNDPNSEVDNGG